MMQLALMLFCWLLGAALIALAGYWAMALIQTREVLFLFAMVVTAGLALGATTMASFEFFKGM